MSSNPIGERTRANISSSIPSAIICFRVSSQRRRELRQLEGGCAQQAALAAAQRQQQRAWLAQLSAEQAGAHWLQRRAAARAAAQLADEAKLAAAEHDGRRRELLAEVADKNRQIETLLSLEASQRAAYEKRLSRRIEQVAVEQVLRSWRTNLAKDGADDG